MLKTVLAAVAAFSMAAAVHAEQIPGSEFSYANWAGAAWTFVGTGNFSHCAVSASYMTGDVLHFSVNAGGTVGVGVWSTAMRLTVGQSFPVTLQVDGRAPFYGTASAATEEFAVLNIPDFDAAMAAFQKGQMLRIESPVGQAFYDLTGTFRALAAAKECALDNMMYNGGVPPVSPALSAVTDKTVLFQVATQMITDLQVADFVYLSDQEAQAQFRTSGVFWASAANGVIGGVTSVPRGTVVNLSDTDGGDVSFLSSRCQGDMATTFRSIAVPDVLAREVHAVCVSGTSTTESYMTKALVGDTIIYTLLIFADAAPDQAPVSRSDLSANAAIKAASYVRNSADGN